MNKNILTAMFCIILIVLAPVSFGQGGPAIAVEIPRYVDDDEIDIIGGTSVGAVVELWVNGQLRRKTDATEGNIIFQGVDLIANEDNMIVLRATDDTGTNEREFMVFSDLTIPEITLGVIPEFTFKKSIMLKADISEAADVEILLNKGSVFSAESVNTFSANISLVEGENNISITATDKAGNTGQIAASVLVDTTPPTITDIKPRRDAFYYEGRAVDDVSGVTEPFAEVTLYYEYEEVAKEKKKRIKVAETTADEHGYFEFEHIDFEHPAPGIKIREVKPGEYIEPAKEQQSVEAAVFILVAVDRAGLTAEEELRVSIGTCWSGWPVFDVNVLPEYQRPSLMSPERLEEGTEVMSFIINLTYGGAAKEYKIMDIYIDPACGRTAGALAEEYKGDLRYEVACDLLQKSRPSLDHNRPKTLWYVEYSHLRTEEYVNFTEDFWKAFTGHELIFPLKLRIGYQEKQPDGTWSSTQYMVKCFSVAYYVDVPIDPRKVLPDWLLERGIDFANKTVQNLDKILPPLMQARDFVGAACIGSWIARWAVRIYRKWACAWDSHIGRLAQNKGKDIKTCPPEKAEEEGKESRLDLTDEQLKTRCPSCASAWKTEAALYKAYRWSCDRIFCHRTPSSWTEKATDVEVFKAEQKARACASEEIAGVLGLDVVKNCWKVYKDRLLKKHVDNKQKICYRYGARDVAALYVRTAEGPETKTFTADGELKKIDVYTLELASKIPGRLEIMAPPKSLKAVKSGNKYATATTYSCEELCKNMYHQADVTSGCVKASTCVKKDGQYEGHVAGYSLKDCWFDTPGFDMSQQCCCYVPKEKKPVEEKGKTTGWTYRQQQLYRETNAKHGTRYRTDRYIPERDRPACFGQEHIQDYLAPAGEKMVPMIDPFSQHTSAFQCLCLTGIIARLQLLRQIFIGMANCLQQIRTTGEADAGVCKELFSQYVCDLIYQAFVQVSQGCISFPFLGELKFDGFTTGSVEESIEAPNLGTAVKLGFGSILDAAKTAAEDLSDEYGNTTLTTFLAGGERQISRKICLAAFGFDIGFDFKSLMEMSYQVQFKTSVSAFGARRDFLTYNPATGVPTYEYRTAWTIFPGCDIRDYSIDLVCVNADEQARYPGIDCSAVGDVQHGEAPKGCNCLYSERPYGERSRKFFVNSAGVSSGIFEDKDHHMVVDDSTVRYDHLRIKINLESGYDPEKCFPEGHEDGVFFFPIADRTAVDLLDCFVDQRGIFKCTRGIEWEKQGEAWFILFSTAECGFGEECYMLCQNPKNRKQWLDCRQINYQLRDNINVKFRVQGTKPQCIYAYVENEAGKKIGDPLKEFQDVGEETIEGEYTTSKLYRFGVVDERSFGTSGEFSFEMINGTCTYTEMGAWDKKPYVAGRYLIKFKESETQKGKYTIEPNGAVVSDAEGKPIDLNIPLAPDDIARLRFVIGGYGVQITDIPFGGGTCLFKVTRLGRHQEWKIHAELRYPDFSRRCGPDAIAKVEPVIGELNEIEEKIDVYDRAPAEAARPNITNFEIVNINGSSASQISPGVTFMVVSYIKGIQPGMNVYVEGVDKDSNKTFMQEMYMEGNFYRAVFTNGTYNPIIAIPLAPERLDIESGNYSVTVQVWSKGKAIAISSEKKLAVLPKINSSK